MEAVCGLDGITYKNQCFAVCNDTSVIHYGACSTSNLPCGCPDVYNPVADI